MLPSPSSSPASSPPASHYSPTPSATTPASTSPPASSTSNTDTSSTSPPSDSDGVHGLFSATIRFETDDLLGALTYGDKEMFLHLVVEPRTLVEANHAAHPTTALWEWASVFDPEPSTAGDHLGGATWVTDTDVLQREIATLADGLRTLAPHIRRADSDAIARIEAARQRRVDADKAERRREAQRADTDLARVAFHANNHAEVVRLLTPWRHTLGPAARKRLDMAERSLQS